MELGECGGVNDAEAILKAVASVRKVDNATSKKKEAVLGGSGERG